MYHIVYNSLMLFKYGNTLIIIIRTCVWDLSVIYISNVVFYILLKKLKVHKINSLFLLGKKKCKKNKFCCFHDINRFCNFTGIHNINFSITTYIVHCMASVWIIVGLLHLIHLVYVFGVMNGVISIKSSSRSTKA